MIRREALEGIPTDFDWFNDYRDTRKWLLTHSSNQAVFAVQMLDAGYRLHHRFRGHLGMDGIVSLEPVTEGELRTGLRGLASAVMAADGQVVAADVSSASKILNMLSHKLGFEDWIEALHEL